MNPRLSPMLAAAFTGMLVGATIVATRQIAGQIGPGSLAFLRYSVGVLILLPPTLLAVRGPEQPLRFAPRDLFPIALLGILQFGILVALLNYGVHFIPAARAALLFATSPLLTMVLAAIVGHERLTLFKTSGVLLALVGVALVLGEQLQRAATPAQEWLGTLAVLGSALCGAICSVFFRPYLQKYPTLPLSTLAMFGAVVFLAFLAAPEGFWQAMPSLHASGWWVVGFIGVSSGVGYLLWMWALKHGTPTRVTIFLTLSPVTASGLGALWLAETVSPTFLAGLVCVAVGVVLAYWKNS